MSQNPDHSIVIDLRGMSATYDKDKRTFTLSGISAKDAHTLIWRGGPVQEQIVVALRHALVDAQDNQMGPYDYNYAVDEADIDERNAR